MTDSTRSGPYLGDLLEVDPADAFDWDTSALADWPNITPDATATTTTDLADCSPATPPAADFDHAHQY